MIRIYVMLAIVSFIGAISYGGYTYFVHVQEQLQFQAEMIAKQEVALATNKVTIDNMTNEAAEQIAANQSLQKNLDEAESGLDELRGKLTDHDLTKLTLRKPGLIEGTINNATKNTLSDLESITSK